MVWLNAALAFAVTMLMLAMVVSTIVETLHRIVGLREKGLRQMLGHLFDQVLSRAPVASDDVRTAFVALMTDNRSPTPAFAREEPARSTPNPIVTMLKALFGWRGLDDLPLQSFMERLGGTELGVRFLRDAEATGKDAADVMLRDLAQKFEAFGDEASVFFERRARLTSVVVSLFVGVFFYVHPRVIVETYLTNTPLTAQVNARYDVVTKAYEDALRAKPDANAEDGQAVRTEIAALQAQVETLQQLSLPIGWVGDKWPRDAVWRTGGGPSAAWWTTLGWLLLGGLLVGLGGPFWYDAVTAITNVRDVLGTTKGADATSPVVAAKTETDAAIEAFRIAATAQRLIAAIDGSAPKDEPAVG